MIITNIIMIINYTIISIKYVRVAHMKEVEQVPFIIILIIIPNISTIFLMIIIDDVIMCPLPTSQRLQIQNSASV